MPKTLDRTLIDYKKSLTPKQVANIAKEILLSVQFIHSKDISHFNLNPNSILVLNNNPDKMFQNLPKVDSNQDIDDSRSCISKDSYISSADNSNIHLINFCQAF